MYVPDDFALTDPARIREVMRDHDFALLVSVAENSVQATHLPFLYDPEAGPNGALLAHMARANPHWRDLARLAEQGGEALIVFQGPHAYVSPTWYGPGPAVPTWNYVAVHAYGAPRLIEEPARVRALLERLGAIQEAGQPTPWSLDGQDQAYIARMLRGIVAFEIRVTRFEAKAKLNQNKRPDERRGAIAGLRASGGALAEAIAPPMDANEAGPG